MEVTIQLRTAFGPGEIVFEFEDVSDYFGRTVRVNIPDKALLTEYERQMDGNPEQVTKTGGAEIPDEPSKNYDVIVAILMQFVRDEFPGFDATIPEVDTGVPGGDAWRG